MPKDTRKQGSFTKYIGIPIEKSKEPKFTEDGFPIARGFFTSDQKDQLGDIITKDATERAIDAYRQWGNIRYMHQPRPVGKVIGIGKADGLKWNEVEFKIVDKDAAFEVDQGLLSALSVGIVVKWEDLELLEDGGFQINDYALAEISLVDHPANYDAVLKGADASEGLRVLARQYGFDNVALGMATLLEKEMEGTMPKEVEKELETEEEIVEEESAEEPEVIEEEKDIEDTEEPAAEEANDVEMEKDVEEETEISSEESAETPEEESQEVVVMEAGLFDLMKDLSVGFTKFVEVLEAQNEKLDRVLETLETSAEVPGEEQPESVEDEAVEELAAEAEETDTAEEKSAAVDREGAIPEVDAESIGEEPDEETHERPKDLKEAIGKYLASKQTSIFG